MLRRAHLAGYPLLLGRTADGDAFAIHPICPHQDKPMDGGNVYGDEVDCPDHHYTYDARTGENRCPRRVFPSAKVARLAPIGVYDTREDDGWVWVRIPG